MDKCRGSGQSQSDTYFVKASHRSDLFFKKKAQVDVYSVFATSTVHRINGEIAPFTLSPTKI